MLSQINYFINIFKEETGRLGKSGYLINRAWLLIDPTESPEKVLFRAGGDLIISSQGRVERGKWELMSAVNSIIISRKENEHLFRAVLVDPAVLILSLDSSEELTIFVDEQIIPDGDILKYFRQKVVELRLGLKPTDNVAERILDSGKVLIIKSYGGKNYPSVGCPAVHADGSDADGYHIIQGGEEAYLVSNSSIYGIYSRRDYFLENDRVLQIWQLDSNNPSIGDRVSMDFDFIREGNFQLSKRLRIEVQEGVVHLVKKKSGFFMR